MKNDTNHRPPSDLTQDVGKLVQMAGPRPAMAEATVSRMQKDLRPVWETEVDRRHGGRPTLRLVAIAALVIAAIGALFFTRALFDTGSVTVARVARASGSVTAWTGNGNASATSLVPGAELELGRLLATGSAGRTALETITGHSLRLDHATRIVFLSEREIRLEQGAVYIDSRGAGRARDSLSVVTAIGRVEEIGTQFEVRLDSDTLTVRVREGAVSVAADGQQHHGVAGEQLTLSAGTLHRTPIGPRDPAFGWTGDIAPGWSLDGSRLDAFLTWVAREEGYSLRYSDESLAAAAPGIVLSGDLEGVRSADALAVVLPAVGLEHRIDGNTLWIDRP